VYIREVLALTFSTVTHCNKKIIGEAFERNEKPAAVPLPNLTKKRPYIHF
jgi:hypothetical protein